MTEQAEVFDRLSDGFYSVGEVRRLAGVPENVSRRYVSSYKGKYGLWGGKNQRLGGNTYLTFRDLIELRHIDSFHSSGVSWQRILRTAQYAKERFETDYPFSDLRFETDGAHIFGETDEGLEQLSRHGQMAFGRVLSGYLFKPLDYLDYEPVRWYPGQEWEIEYVGRGVIVDPRISFGTPVIADYHVPTEVLYLNYRAELNDPETVARNYEIPLPSVVCAVAFQKELLNRNVVAQM